MPGIGDPRVHRAGDRDAAGRPRPTACAWRSPIRTRPPVDRPPFVIGHLEPVGEAAGQRPPETAPGPRDATRPTPAAHRAARRPTGAAPAPRRRRSTTRPPPPLARCRRPSGLPTPGRSRRCASRRAAGYVFPVYGHVSFTDTTARPGPTPAGTTATTSSPPTRHAGPGRGRRHALARSASTPWAATACG